MNGQGAWYLGPIFWRRTLFVNNIQQHDGFFGLEQPNKFVEISVFKRTSSMGITTYAVMVAR